MNTIPISSIYHQNHKIDILRLDLAFNNMQGNKFFKLKYNIEQALQLQHQCILTFGGAYSNHIHALAYEAKKNGMKSIGVVRGEADEYNPTLKFAKKNNMHLHFISRQQYKDIQSEQFINTLHNLFGEFYLLPEGGSNELAVKGCSEILAGIETAYDYIFCPVGTGGTLAGLITTPGISASIIGISALKGDDTLHTHVHSLSENKKSAHCAQWQINFNYHFGGYAKNNAELIAFIQNFYKQYHIKLDPIYTAKTMFATFDMLGKIPDMQTKKILVIHTGGIQGIEGWEQKFGRVFE